MIDKKEWQDVTIDGTQYHFDTLNPIKAFPVSVKLGKLLAGALKESGKELTSLFKESKKDNVGIDSILSIIGRLAESVKVDEFNELAQTMISCVKIKGENDTGFRAVNYQQDFNGKIMELYKVLFFAIRFNFADFFVERVSTLVEKVEAQVS